MATAIPRATAEQVDDYFWALLSPDLQAMHLARNGGERQVARCYPILTTFDANRLVRVTVLPPYESPEAPFRVGDVLHAPVIRSCRCSLPSPGEPYAWCVWAGGRLWLLAPWEGKEVDTEHLSDDFRESGVAS
jgi:hypothetical protein